MLFRSEVFFSHPAHYADFEAFAASRIARSARDAELMEARLDEVRALFEARARPDDGFLLDRATRVNLLVKKT